jgi:hypothetical protein
MTDEALPFSVGDQVRVTNPESYYSSYVGYVTEIQDDGPAWPNRWTIILRWYEGERIGFHVNELSHVEDAVTRLGKLAPHA